MAAPAVPERFEMTQGFRDKHILADDDFDAEDYDQKAAIIQRRYDIEGGEEHEYIYLKASEVNELMQTANWDCYVCYKGRKRRTQNTFKTNTECSLCLASHYVTKRKVTTYVVTKYNEFQDQFKTKTDYLYVDCFEDNVYRAYHMQEGHQ